MKALEIWTNGDPYERKSKGGADLDEFNKYRNGHLKQKFPHDNAQLLRYETFSLVNLTALTVQNF